MCTTLCQSHFLFFAPGGVLSVQAQYHRTASTHRQTALFVSSEEPYEKNARNTSLVLIFFVFRLLSGFAFCIQPFCKCTYAQQHAAIAGLHSLTAFHAAPESSLQWGGL